MTCVRTYWPAYIGAPEIKTSRKGRKTPEKIQVDNERKRHFAENYQLVILSSTNNVGTPVKLGIEASASSHHWSRELQALGHTVQLMPPAYVKRLRCDRGARLLARHREHEPPQAYHRWHVPQTVRR
jgi:transposase